MRIALRFTVAVSFALAITAASPVHAPVHAEEWKDHARVRLIDGGRLPDGVTRLAGIEIDLDPGWKTYWRNPGDSGIPPNFDLSASANVAGTTIEWPAPESHFDGYGWVIGYTDTVIFPVLVRPADASKASELKLHLDYAVCKDICIPAEADLAAVLDGNKPRTAEIEFYRARVPERLGGTTDTAGIVSASIDRKAGVPVLGLRLKFPSGAGDAFSVVEGPDGWYLPVPERVGEDSSGAVLFQVPLDGAPDPAEIAGTVLWVTGVSPAYAFEQELVLD